MNAPQRPSRFLSLGNTLPVLSLSLSFFFWDEI